MQTRMERGEFKEQIKLLKSAYFLFRMRDMMNARKPHIRADDGMTQILVRIKLLTP